MRYLRWPTLRALTPLPALLALLVGCALFGSPTVSKPGVLLPAVLVSSVKPSLQGGGAGMSTLHIQALNPRDGSVRWSYQAIWHPWHPAAAPVVANGIVYAESDTIPSATPTSDIPSGDLTALSERDGHKLWSVHIGFLASPPVVAGGVLYTSSLSTNSAKRTVASFFALRADNGQQIWRTDITNNLESKATLDQGIGVFNTIQFVDGALYITSNQLCFDYCSAAYLLALRASDGKRLWKVTIPGNLNIASPVIGGGALFVMVPSVYDESINAMAPSKLVAYNASDGALRWKALMGSGRPVDVVGDTVYATATVKDEPSNPDSTLTTSVNALDAATGATRWRFTTFSHGSDTLLSLLGVTPDTVYVQSRSSSAYTLSALNPQDGSVRWHTPLQAPLGSLLLNGAPLYALSGMLAQQASDHPYANLVALDPASGHTLWTAPISPAPRGDIPASVLAPDGGMLLAAYYANTLNAISAHDGSVLWKVTTPGGLIGVTVVE